MRIHKIDNDRTRRHMYRNAPESLYYKYIVSRDDVIAYSYFGNEGYFHRDIQDKAQKLSDKLSSMMRHKHHKSRCVRIPVKVDIFETYDIDYNRYNIVIEARHTPRGGFDA